jgi:hypothetical protein
LQRTRADSVALFGRQRPVFSTSTQLALLGGAKLPSTNVPLGIRTTRATATATGIGWLGGELINLISSIHRSTAGAR